MLNLDPKEAEEFFNACEKDDEGQVGMDDFLAIVSAKRAGAHEEKVGRV